MVMASALAAEGTEQMQRGPRRHTHTLLRIFHETVSSNSDSVRGFLPASSTAAHCVRPIVRQRCRVVLLNVGLRFHPAPDSSCALTGLVCIETPRRDAMQPRHKCASSERVSLSTSKAKPQLLLSLMATHVLRYNTTSHALTWLGFGRGLCEPLIGLCEPLAGVCATLLQSRLFSVPPLCPCAGSPSPARIKRGEQFCRHVMTCQGHVIGVSTQCGRVPRTCNTALTAFSAAGRPNLFSSAAKSLAKLELADARVPTAAAAFPSSRLPPCWSCFRLRPSPGLINANP